MMILFRLVLPKRRCGQVWYILGQWSCDIDTDTQLDEATVEGFVTNGIGAFDLSAGTTLMRNHSHEHPMYCW